jgi:hypothetical protein
MNETSQELPQAIKGAGVLTLSGILLVIVSFTMLLNSNNPVRQTSPATSSTEHGNQSFTLPINTEVWKEIRVTYGKSMKNFRIKPQNGRVYKWYLVVNGDFKNPHAMPSGADLGNNVQTLHCILAKDQGVETAEIDYAEK